MSSRNPVTAPQEAPREILRTPSVGTIVWGVIVLAVVALTLGARIFTLHLDAEQVLIGLLVGSGALLLLGGGLIIARGRRSDRAGDE